MIITITIIMAFGGIITSPPFVRGFSNRGVPMNVAGGAWHCEEDGRCCRYRISINGRSTVPPRRQRPSPQLQSTRHSKHNDNGEDDNRPNIVDSKKQNDSFPGAFHRLELPMMFTKSVLSILFIGILSIMSLTFPVSAVTTTTMHNDEASSTIIVRDSNDVPISSSSSSRPPSRPASHDQRRPYDAIQMYGTEEERIQSNLQLLDYMIGTINTMYYDVTGGTQFDPRTFYQRSQHYIHERVQREPRLLSTRDGVVSVLRGIVNDILQDPYSSYLTREELRNELSSSSVGGARKPEVSLGIVIKEGIQDRANQFLFGPTFTIPLMSPLLASWPSHLAHQNPLSSSQHAQSLLSPMEGYQLPAIVAVSPNSLGERWGLTVGDRIIASPLPGRPSYTSIIDSEKSALVMTIAKPIYDVSFTKSGTNNEIEVNDVIDQSLISNNINTNPDYDYGITSPDHDTDSYNNNNIRGYRPIRVRIPMSTGLAAEMDQPLVGEKNSGFSSSTISGGNAYVHYEVLSNTNSIFQKNYPMTNTCRDPSRCNNDVGYIRLTRFSRASTKGFMDAVQTLESMGIRRYIIDVRNNYGGVIQEAMLCAATLLRDPHMVLCYTMNSRGGMTPHDVEEYVMDTRYPGYWLSRESHDATRLQVQREHPARFRSSSTEEWLPMSSFASLHEQHVKRGIKLSNASTGRSTMQELQQLAAQKDVVLLINEGTASSAEVFASSLHDNGRTVALVGTKTYGKGLVQHTFPTPDGGGLRLTVVEYLTPALHHVTHVGGAQYDRFTGAYIGGGIQPDIVCDSIHGIPGNVGSDLCVGVAIDALNEADHVYQSTGQLSVKRVGGVDDGSRARRTVTMGILRVSFAARDKKLDQIVS